MGTVTLLTNPKRRTTRKPAKVGIRKARKAKTARKYPVPSKARASSAARVLRRRRRNPAGRGVVDTNLLPALKGAAGAVVLETLYDMLPIPPQYQVGMVGNLVKAGAAIGIGMAADKAKVLKGGNARDLVNGALTVQFAGMMREIVGGAMATATPAPEATGYISPAPVAGNLGMYEQGAYDGGFSTGLGVYETVPAGY